MSVATRTRRSIIVDCKDCDCKFKQVNRGVSKMAGECALELGDAIRFHQKFGFTTCELGMGERKVSEVHMQNEGYINRLKYKGRI